MLGTSGADIAYGPDDGGVPASAATDLVVVRPVCTLIAGTKIVTPVSVCGVYALNAGAANVGPVSVRGLSAFNTSGPANVVGVTANGILAANLIVGTPILGTAAGVVALNALIGAPRVFGATGISVFNLLASAPRRGAAHALARVPTPFGRHARTR